MTVLYSYLCYKKMCRDFTIGQNVDCGGKVVCSLLQFSEKWSGHISHVGRMNLLQLMQLWVPFGAY